MERFEMALTFDDVLLKPGYSEVLPREVDPQDPLQLLLILLPFLLLLLLVLSP